MTHQFSRRQFNQAAVVLPLFGLTIGGSDVPKQKSLRLQVQCHRICVDGRHLAKDDWRLEFWIRVVQRKQTDPRYWYGRFMKPTSEFAQRLRGNSIAVERHRYGKYAVAERTTLRNGVAGLCCMLDAVFPTERQDEFFVDPTPERWGEYTIPETQAIKRFWIGEA